ncbi:carboxypeptidase-like regulatory domain-containing protein [Aureibaculum sp. 2210JD6-5]|uniref:TonB-dependent receptor n=1 Tax=Aureibaculum sp. 2210JD6-5 TaxID=3103957 RepID=UPI002AAEDBE0|nr:carboxypeptidase-like regulatory domain-containing protein [Aureibaculum sp. 2210JD6-5]MDY7395677.1 carboxypeptidase-like regulatory domain-containing protein [Aureibaculum sp. 2210JD6-5]
MKKITQLFLVVLCFVMSSAIYAQTITGTVQDETGPLPGANILEKGTTNGTTTDFDGKFSLNVKEGSGNIVISFIGFSNKTVKFTVAAGETKDLGAILLESDNTLEEVVVRGVVDIARDRETPVAVSTIRAAEIVENLGTKEFPEILNTTPSVYATKQGGGFGDARINIRGFDQRNTAVMINGMPVNDMENGWVYWSNWAGLSDVTSAMQVQRGLGSSKLAISSVGGTINVLTRASDKSEGGSATVSIGNDSRLKTTIAYNTGKLDNGLSVSALFGRTAGDGYVDGTEYEGYNYYLAFGFQPNDSHDFQFTVTGAPQRHNTRGFAPSLSNYIKYGNKYGDPDIKYNSDWGYRNGKEETFGGNFYHKPIASLNWDWNLSESSTISTVLYASLGRGGSVGSIGRINGRQSFQLSDDNGLVRFDDIIAYNSGQAGASLGDRDVYTGGAGGPASILGMYVNGSNNPGQHFSSDRPFTRGSENGISQRSSMNSHNWFGVISNFNTELTENLTMDFGIDLRSYKGIHYRRLVDLLGGDVYIDNDNINELGRVVTETYAPEIYNIWNVFKNVDDEVKIDYYNDGKVKWGGVFGQLEYTNGVVSTFIQGAFSSQSFKRIDYFNYLDSDSEQESDWENLLGGNIKGGINWNINEQHNIFANTGYYSKQPIFDAVFPSFTSNETNDNLVNEKVFGLEAGYGFRSENYRVNINLYRTSWKDRFSRSFNTFDVNNTPDNSDDDVRGTANLNGITQVHKGIEVESTAKFGNLRVNLMTSIGDWEYKDNVTAAYFDNSENPIPGSENETLYLKGVKVGDAAQFTARLGFDYEILEGLKFDISQFYADKLYADFDAESFDSEADQENGALRLPSYSLIDAGLSYKLDLKSMGSLNFRLNVNNLANRVYISESETNFHVRPGDDTWKGIATGNRVYFGWGRTWSATVRYNF